MVSSGKSQISGKLLALALLPMLVVVAARLAGPQDLDKSSQDKQALYVLDIWEHGNVILPLEQGYISPTKPPLYPWLAALSSIPTGRPSVIASRAPSALAALVTVWLIFLIGSQRWGAFVGVAAAWIFAVSHIAIRLSVQIRPDMVLTLLTTSALLALHRQERGRSRGTATLFWAALSLSLLAKGPVGALIILAPCVVLSFAKDWRDRLRPLFRSSWAWLVLIPLVWFALAYMVGGDPYWKNAVLPETVERVLGAGSRADRKGPLPGYLFVQFLQKFAPWSIFTLIGMGVFFSRRTSHHMRKALGLPVVWLLVGLVGFNLSRGQRPDYLLPLLPAASLAAAAAMADTRLRAPSRIWRGFLLVAAAGTLFLGICAITGITSALAALDELARPARVAWGVILVATGLILGWIFGPAWNRNENLVRTPAFLLGTMGLLVCHVFYINVLSPVAKSGQGADLAAFAGQVNDLRRGEDRVVLYGSVSRALRVLTRLNRPALALHEIPWCWDSAEPGGRFLVITTSEGEGEIAGRWPGRFKPLLRKTIGRKHGTERVLLEFIRGEGGKTLPQSRGRGMRKFSDTGRT